RVSGVRVPACPSRDRTRAGVAARLEVSRPVRLPARALRFNPPGLDCQASWVRPRPRDADLVAHLRLPVRPPRGELRTEVVDSPVRRLRRRDAPPRGSNLGDALGRPVPGLRLELPSGVPRRGTLDRDAPP